MDEKDGSDLRIGKNTVRDIGHEVTDRISGDACLKISLQEEKRIKEKVRLASLVAERAGRKTVREEDVMVVEEILESKIS